MDSLLILSDLRNALASSTDRNDTLQRLAVAEQFCAGCSMTPFGELINCALIYAKHRLEMGQRAAAALEIQFVHNLPMSRESLKKWDREHFFRVELLSFVDTTNDWSHIQCMIQILGIALSKIDDDSCWP
jgi:hypothetical protein